MDLVNLLAKQLDAQSLHSLRQVSKLLCSKVSQLWTSVTMNRQLRTRQAKSLQGFPNLTSITLKHPETTFHLASLTRLTKVSLISRLPAHQSGSVDYLTVDVSPLACLPKLHTLALRRIASMPINTASAMSELTQLRALELQHCSTRSSKGHISRVSSDAQALQPHNLSCLPLLTKLQVVDSFPWLSAGLVNLQRVGFSTASSLAYLASAVYLSICRYCPELHRLSILRCKLC